MLYLIKIELFIQYQINITQLQLKMNSNRCPFSNQTLNSNDDNTESNETFYKRYIEPSKFQELKTRTDRNASLYIYFYECLFITTHKKFELTFLNIINCIHIIISELCNNIPNLNQCTKMSKNIVAYLRNSFNEFDNLETMDHMDFLEFRDKLENGSGQQSVNFRIIEALFGINMTSPDKINILNKLSIEDQNEIKKSTITTLKSAVLNYLESISNDENLKSEIENFKSNTYKLIKNKEILNSLNAHQWVAFYFTVYKKKYYEHFDFIESLVAIDETFTKWRNLHISMVERMIGEKIGTGGTEGVNYLRSTISQTIFPELTKIRTICIKSSNYERSD